MGNTQKLGNLVNGISIDSNGNATLPGNRIYIGKDGSNMVWFGTKDAISEPNNLAFGFESNGTSIQSFKIMTAGSTRFFVNNAGNVGIGTSSPSYLLDVQNGNDFNIRIKKTALGGTVGLLFETSNDFSGTSQAYIKGIGAGNSGLSTLIFGTAGASGDTTATERMRITSGGNVGIGTTDFTSIGSTDKALRVQASSGTSYIQAISGDSGSSVSLYSGASSGDNPSLLFRNSLRFGTTTDNVTGGYAERMRITSGGGLMIGTSSDTGRRLYVLGSTSTSSAYCATFDNSSGNTILALRNDLVLFSPAIYNNTYANSANVYVGADGAVGRSTSSLKYKENVIDYNKGLSEVMKLRPVSYTSKNPSEYGLTFAGLIAEEVHDLGLTEFVQYAEDESPDALAYQNMIALLTKAIQEQNKLIDGLNQRLNALENK